MTIALRNALANAAAPAAAFVFALAACASSAASAATPESAADKPLHDFTSAAISPDRSRVAAIESDDLAGIDAVGKLAPIDDARLRIAGGSYGGYMTMWAVTQTQRFKAGVAGAGLSDWIS